MKYITNRIKIHFLLIASAMVILSSCNKDLQQYPAAPVTQGTTPTLANLLDGPDLTIFKAAVLRTGIMPSTLAVPSLRFTVFAPTDAAMTASGLSLGVVNALPLTTLTPLIQYHIMPQTIATSNIPNTFPNFSYPSIFNPAPPLSSLLRLNTFPSTRNGNWVNNIPMTATNITAVNGVMHKMALVTAPPSRYAWDRINTDADLSLFKAIIQRGDQASTPATNLQGILLNIGANLTVFAPSNLAIQQLIAGLTGGAIPPGSPEAVYIAFINSANIPPQLAQGIAFYHVMAVRAFTNNLPTTATSYPTLLNGAVPTHPGVSLVCTFTGPVVSAASVKGAANATASIIAINPTPDPGGTSDQHFLNASLHKINQVLLPQ